MRKATRRKTARPRKTILVAGDVCLDVIAVPVKPRTRNMGTRTNWRLTGEKRTHYLRGGAMLLSQMIEAATADVADVVGPVLPRPEAVESGKGLITDQELDRLKRDEVIHSLLEADYFPKQAGGSKSEKDVLRVSEMHGFSGPMAGDPSLKPSLPQDPVTASILVLDDTGNEFRREPGQWPAIVTNRPSEPPLVLLKLNRPLPSNPSDLPNGSESHYEESTNLWQEIERNHTDNRITIITVNDLRDTGAPISLGLSWERTALDIVWQIAHNPRFEKLRECPRLVIQIGLDGAVLMLRYENPAKAGSGNEWVTDAWLVYDPQGIEGSYAGSVPGRMVGYGSAFCAGMTGALARLDDSGLEALKKPAVPIEGRDPLSPWVTWEAMEKRDQPLLDAIRVGLTASRRLLQHGYETKPGTRYPGKMLFEGIAEEAGRSFCCHPIPWLPNAWEPDRTYWRLLESIYIGRKDGLNRTVQLVALKKTKPDNGEDTEALDRLRCAPLAVYGELRTYDRGEIENYRSLHSLLHNYLSSTAQSKPVSIGVFGPPGAGKSFGVEQVVSSLKGLQGICEVKALKFNLSLYKSPDELAGAFHLVRDESLRGKVPLVFFDEFDTPLGGTPLGWLRYFLAPMQDGEFLDRGAPHPIGRSIFVFAGGTSFTYRDFMNHRTLTDREFRDAKGPDFLSRLRATLDIPSLNYLTAYNPRRGESQPPDTYDPLGPIEAFPSEASILLRRATILSFQFKKHAPGAIQSDGSLGVSPEVIRLFLHMPGFLHGNRSLEAIIGMSHLHDARLFSSSLLPASFQMTLHANAEDAKILVATEYPVPQPDREKMAEFVHEEYLRERRQAKEHDPHKRSHQEWKILAEDVRETNRAQVDQIAEKLRSAGLWFRKTLPGKPGMTSVKEMEDLLLPHLERLARMEHDRWCAQQRKLGWVPASTPHGQQDKETMEHGCLFPWEELPSETQKKDKDTVRLIPQILEKGGYEIYPIRG